VVGGGGGLTRVMITMNRQKANSIANSMMASLGARYLGAELREGRRVAIEARARRSWGGNGLDLRRVRQPAGQVGQVGQVGHPRSDGLSRLETG